MHDAEVDGAEVDGAEVDGDTVDRDTVDRDTVDRDTQAAAARGAGDGWPLDSARSLAVAVRSGRRRLGFNQRGLAAAAGVSQATIARLEAEHDVGLRVTSTVLAALGLRMVVVGAAVDERPEDGARDTAGRRLPAHLVAQRTDRLPLATHLRRTYRGGPLLPVRGDFWVYERPYPWPATTSDDDVTGGL